jgi:hypothetical protein
MELYVYQCRIKNATIITSENKGSEMKDSDGHAYHRSLTCNLKEDDHALVIDNNNDLWYPENTIYTELKP